MSFWTDLKNRQLGQWTLAYLAAAWLVWQVTDVAGDRWGLTSGLGRVLDLLLTVGFFVTLVLAWYHGEKGRQRVSGPELLLIGGIFALSAVLLPVVWSPFQDFPDENRGSAGEMVADAFSERIIPSASIAVLPFENLSSDPEQDYFSDGLAEEILNILAQVAELHVTSRSSAFAFKGQAIEVPEVAARLGVAHVLEGSVQKVGNTVRITAQLIEAATDRHLWSERFDRELDLSGIFAVQDEIAAAIVEALLATMGLEVAPAIRPTPVVGAEAYEFYLRGRQEFNRRTPESFERAIEHFRNAIDVAPGYAPAYAALASAYGVSVSYGLREPEPYVAARQALAMADSALAHDADQPEAHAARLNVLRYLWAPFPEVMRSADRAIELEPNSANTHGWYAHLLARDGRIDESIVQDERAIALDPLAPGRRLGFTWNALGGDRYEIALREAERGLALSPGHPMALAGKALALLMLDRPRECIEIDVAPYVGINAMCLQAAGDTSAAHAVINAVTSAALAGSDGDSNYGMVVPLASVATYYAWTGDASESLAWLKRAYDLSPESVLFWILDSEVYSAAREDPDFRRSLANIRRGLRR